jgi:NitT/TauT family transport system ATP-binding protein
MTMADREALRRTRSSSRASGISSRPATGWAGHRPRDLAIGAGEFVTLLGPSGCGKTTLLKAIAGFIKPTEGSILCDGVPVRAPGRERGVVFQELAILPWRTVRRNIGHGLEIARVPRAERERAVARLIELTGLTGFEDRYPHELSGGMRQRVAVARTWAADPEVILMDEPFAAVDAMTRLTLQEELVRLCATTRKTVFFITHSVDEAVFLGDRVLVMTRRPGRIKAVIDVPGRLAGRDWESFKVDAGMQAIAEQVLRLVREERGAAAPSAAAAGAEAPV